MSDWKCGKCGGTPYEHSLSTSTCVWEPVLIATEQRIVRPPVIRVVTPESSKGDLWAEIVHLRAVYAEAVRTIAQINKTHREVSEMQATKIDELERLLGS